MHSRSSSMRAGRVFTAQPDNATTEHADAVRPKTLRREHISGFIEAVKVASDITREEKDEIAAGVRVLAEMLGVGKSRAFKMVSPNHPETMTLADLIMLLSKRGDDEDSRAARTLARGILARVAEIASLGEDDC